MYQFSLLNSVTLSDSNTHKNVYYDIKMDSFKSVQNIPQWDVALDILYLFTARYLKYWIFLAQLWMIDTPKIIFILYRAFVQLLMI